MASGLGKPTDEATRRQATRVAPWFRDKGDSTLRLNYDLTQDSVVVDLGGYKGQWAADIFTRYDCQVHIFEPYKVYASDIAHRFSQNPKVKVYDFGLSGSDQELSLAVSDDASSSYKSSGDKVTIYLKEAKHFFEDSGIEEIDLMKINIEGGEYDLLEHLLDTGYINHIDNIQVQFHDFVPDAGPRMKAIQDRLSATHYTTYQYEFVWENWRRK